MRGAIACLAVALATALAPAVEAGVKTEERTLVKFGGPLGGILNKFGGKAAKEGVVMDDYTDRWKGNSTLDETSRPGVSDWYPTGKIGFNFYFGNKEDEDADGDGLTLAEERKYGTNPYNADSDGDRLGDGEEIWRYNTDPLKADTDGDNLSDGDEVFKYKTFPNKPDTDDDGLNDGAEILRHDTNPLVSDTDGDGLIDGARLRNTEPIR